MENKGKVFKNTYIVSFFTFLSRIFGYLRDAAIFIFINNSQGALDSFFVAFRIPNFFRRIFGEGALSVAYIPVLTEYKAQNNNKELKEFVDSSVSIIALVLLEIAGSILLGSKLYVFFSISTKTGLAPKSKIVSTVAKKENGVVITSSPGFIPRLFKLSINASVPLETPTEYLTPR